MHARTHTCAHIRWRSDDDKEGRISTFAMMTKKEECQLFQLGWSSIFTPIPGTHSRVKVPNPTLTQISTSNLDWFISVPTLHLARSCLYPHIVSVLWYCSIQGHFDQRFPLGTSTISLKTFLGTLPTTFPTRVTMLQWELMLPIMLTADTSDSRSIWIY